MVWTNKTKTSFRRLLRASSASPGTGARALVTASSHQTTPTEDDELIILEHQQQERVKHTVRPTSKRQEQTKKQQKQKKKQQQLQLQQRHELQRAPSILVSSTDDEGDDDDDDDDDTKNELRQGDKNQNKPGKAQTKTKWLSSFLKRGNNTTTTATTSRDDHDNDDNDGDDARGNDNVVDEESKHHRHQHEYSSQSVKKTIRQQNGNSHHGLRDPPPPTSYETTQHVFKSYASPVATKTSHFVDDRSHTFLKRREKKRSGAVNTFSDVMTPLQKGESSNFSSSVKKNHNNNVNAVQHHDMDSLVCGNMSFHDDDMLDTTTDSLLSCEEAELNKYAASYFLPSAAAASGVSAERQQQQMDTPTTALHQDNEKSRVVITAKGTKQPASSKLQASAAAAINNSTINDDKDLHFVGFDCSCQAPDDESLAPRRSDITQGHHPKSATASSSLGVVDSSPSGVISARSLVGGHVHVVLLEECDYIRNCTALYKRLEQEDWQGVDEFLDTGVWPDDVSLSKADPTSPVKQVRTWVTRFDEQDATKVHWSVLPLQ
jgi:hypothetical protein